MINFIIPIILLIIVLFIGFNFYRDIKLWMNTGSFVEGLTPHSSPDRKYYNGCHYVLNKELKSWTEHEEQANRQGGHLVCIHSKEENDIVKSLVPKYQQGVMPNYIFIGARRIKECEATVAGCTGSGTDGNYWSWVDGSKWDYTNWGNGEPNDCCKGDTEGVGEPLGMMWESGQWNDIFHKHQSWGKGEPWNTDGTIRFPAVYKFCEKPKPNLYKKTFDGGWTWQMAKDSCEQDGNKLATKKEVIDYISTPVNGDNWVPVADNPNDWVQIGDRKSQPKAPRQDFGLLNQEIPDIGFLVGDNIPDAKWHYAGGRPKWGDKNGEALTSSQHLLGNGGTKYPWKKEYYCKGDKPDPRNPTVPCKDTIDNCDVHYKNGGCLEANPLHWHWRTSCVKTCGYCDDPEHNPALETEPIKYTTMTKLRDFCGDGNNETTKMEWEGQDCGDGKIKWMSMKSTEGRRPGYSLDQCSWTRGDNSNWNNTYVGDCGVSPTYIKLPTNVSQISQQTKIECVLLIMVVRG